MCKREKKLSQQEQTELLRRVSRAVAVHTDKYSDYRQHVRER